jgi:uncharacterized cupredoxin-like copper-binding protein
MPVIQEPPELREHAGRRPDDPTRAALADVQAELRAQGQAIRRTQQGFSIFAGMALVLAMASLLAVAFKLDRKPTVVVRSATPTSAPPPAPLEHNIDVALQQFSVNPSARAAAVGRITFRVHNAGSITHEFVVVKTPRQAADLPIVKGRAAESGNVGETGDLAPATTRAVTLKLAAGHYALICNLAGHYLAGQHTDFTVR